MCGATRYALLEMWRQKGVEPCAVLGHSVGEFAAAVASQVLPLAEALRLVAARGRLIAELCEPWLLSFGRGRRLAVEPISSSLVWALLGFSREHLPPKPLDLQSGILRGRSFESRSIRTSYLSVSGR